MLPYENSIVPLIEANYDRFTSAEKTVADFFISNGKEMDFSAKVMAKQLHVSEASLSRFAKKMGYDGYREFIYHYKPSLPAGTHYVGERSAEVLNAYQELLTKTYNLIQEEQVERIVKLLLQKRRIFVYGFGSSGLAAQELKLRLIRLGLDVEAITEFHEMVLNETRVQGECLVIGISLSGQSREVTDAMLEAAGKGAATVFITSHNEKCWQEAFDEVMLTAVKKNLEYGNVISPQFPILVLLDIIYAGCLEKMGGAIERRNPDTAMWSRLKKYHNEKRSVSQTDS